MICALRHVGVMFIGHYFIGLAKMNTRSGFVRRRSSNSMQSNKKTTEQRLLTLTRKVNALNPELKSYQVSGSFTNVTAAAGQIGYVSSVAQGADVFNRIGDKIQAKELTIYFKPTGGDTGNFQDLYGVYLIKDLESNGVVPVVSGTAQSIFANPGPLQAIINTNVKDRFKMVKRWVYAGVAVAVGNQNPYHEFKCKLNHVMNYHDATGAQTGAGKNAYYLVVLSDDAANTIDFSWYAELRFVDA